MQPSCHGPDFSVLGLDGVAVGHQMIQIRRGRGRPLGSKNKLKKTRKRGRPKKHKCKSPSKSSRTSRLESSYCKVCGSRDHVRSTRRQCPKHPEYAPQRSSSVPHASSILSKRMRSDSYEIPQELLYGRSEDENLSQGGDWSGRPGFRCEICGRRSENVGPRRGFDYRLCVCGGCTELD